MLSDQRKGVGYKRKHARFRENHHGGWRQVGQGELRLVSPPKPSGESVVKTRLIETAERLVDAPEDVAYQHSILCQTGLPYRNPGKDVREWMRDQGNASLLVQAGKAHDPESGKWEELALPWGPKARLVLMHLNSTAVRMQSPTVDVGDSLTSFVKRIGLTTDGRTIRSIKDQVGALSAAMIRLAFTGPKNAYQFNAPVVTGFDLWFPKDHRQRVLWPSVVRLSKDYFDSLLEHAVPLDERAIGALSHSALS